MGFIPGPNEPSDSEIRAYITLIVDELVALYDGVGEDRIYAILTAVIADTPARATCLGFCHQSSNRGCADCTEVFVTQYSPSGNGTWTDDNIIQLNILHTLKIRIIQPPHSHQKKQVLSTGELIWYFGTISHKWCGERGVDLLVGGKRVEVFRGGGRGGEISKPQKTGV